ncbi:MAG TPA: amidohydrolase family protein [bacterium]|nr:amidohydrolase family protein [bacterium]
MTTSVAIVGPTIVTMNGVREVIDEGTVVIDRGRFAAVTRGTRDPGADRLIRGAGCALLPGLINCHLHTRPGRALGDGLSLFDWHALYPDNLCRQMTDADSRAGALLAFADSLRRGTTTVMDMTCRPAGAFAAAEEIGIRARIVPLAADAASAGDGACDVYAEFVDGLGGRVPPPDARVQYWLGFDAVNGVDEATLRRMAADAKRLGVGIHGHMSESRDDAGWTDRERGVPAAIYLGRAGVLGPRTLLAHCNWLVPEEIALLAGTGTSVSHNPTSNMKLGTGVAPVPELRARGVTVGLGTDGMLSNFHLDMFEVMRGACMLQRIHRLDAHALMSWDVLEMATRDGAKAIGEADNLGSIETGKRADAILLDLGAPHFRPLVRGRHDNLAALLVWCGHGSDVRTVIVDGTVVVEDRRLCLADEAAIMDEAQRTAERLLAALPERVSG